MPARRSSCTSRPSVQPRSAAPCPAAVAEDDVPMRVWPHPIAQPAACPQQGCPSEGDLAPLLEQLVCQNQLLVDLLGAVNSLTAAILGRSGKI